MLFRCFIGAGFEGGGVRNLALRAWAACQVGLLPGAITRLQRAATIDTMDIPRQDLSWLAKFTRISWQLYALKPSKVKNDVHAEFSKQDDILNVNQTRFKTRMRDGGNQKLHVEFNLQNGATVTTQGRVNEVHGRSARISIHKPVAASATIKSIVTIGKDPPTYAESERDLIVLSVLQRTLPFFQQPIVHKIFDQSSPGRPREPNTSDYEIHLAGRRLNDSQAAAVDRIISDDPDDQICLVLGRQARVRRQ
ncbi:uncharacterized protein B0H18DRAFT_687078 [Fomitopsis serialis]|uniref:uncharacterized protein n=1 Tax=Fomitopsis serialis TaxID=139415 RepID=UPI002008C7C1|nr:uncharacterized protein B0H18DRAFT_687078 [Neoantrodia serialis]KAH9917840.1 hypothetical protein B0H18DRAFT_687078 [Neoantrodia serialis]